MLEKQSQEKNIFGRIMTLSYVAALTILVLLNFHGHFLLKNGIKTLETDARIINIAGRQRMLSQRIEHLTMHLILAAGDEKQVVGIRQELTDAINLMEESHHGLLNGAPKIGLPGNPSEEIKILYFQEPDINRRVREFISNARVLLSLPLQEISLNNPYVSYILRTAHTDLLDALDKAVQQYEIESNRRIANLQILQKYLLVTRLFVLVLMALFIFRPLTHKAQNEINKTKAAEESLRQSRQALEALIRSSPLAIVTIDWEGKLTLWNPAAARIFGWAEAEVLGKFLPTVPKDKLEQFHTLRERVLKGNGFSGLEVQRQRKDGLLIDISLSTAPLYDVTGKVVGMMGIMDDITERKRLYNLLCESEARYRTLVEHVDIGISLVDKNYKIVMVNSFVAKMFGKQVSDFIGKDCFREFEKCDKICAHCPGTKAMAIKEPVEVETEGVLDDGSRFPVRIRAFPFIGPDAEVSGFIEVSEDITQRKYAEEALKMSEANLRLLLESIPDCVCKISITGKFISINTAGCYLRDLDKPEETIGAHFLDEVIENRQALEAAFKYVFKSGETASLQYKTLTKKGRQIWWDAKLAPVRDAKGEINSILRVSRDITAHKKAEEALKVSEEYFRSLIENMPDSVCRITFDGKIITVNKAGYLMEGFSKPQEALGYSRTDHAVENRVGLQEAIQRAANGETASVQYKSINTRAREIWWDATLVPLRDAKGNITSVLIVSKDITEQAAVQEQRKNIILGLRTIMAIADRLIIAADTDSLLKAAVEEARGKLHLERCAIFLEHNGYMQGTYGTDRKGQTTDERNHRFTKDTAWQKYTETMRAGEAQWFVVKEPYLEWDGTKNVRLDGEGWIAITPIRSAHKVLGVFVNDTAISKQPLEPSQQEILSVYSSLVGAIIERKRAVDLMEKSSQFNENLLQTIPFGMDLVDEEGIVLYANEKMKRVLGDDPTRKKCWVAYKDDKEQCAHCPLKKGVNIGETKILETSGAMGGKIVRITHTGTVYENKKAVLEIFEDITKEREAEQRLREALAVKSEFVSMVSHELRTPLTAIKEGIAIVADESAGTVNPEQKNFLEIAERNVQRLSRFINNVLDYQKLDSGRMEFYMKPGDINETVDEVRDDLLIQAEAKKLKLHLKLAEHLPQINFDKDKIIQVLTNLVYNAIKFTEAGAIEIATLKIDDAIRVSISDTGIGIKKEDMRRLFQDFTQLATGKERKTGSTGLGLTISRKLIIHHGGQIWAESEFGKGSTFYFTLPIK